MGSCQYQFDPAEHPTATLEASWECPHEAHEDSTRCIFHMSKEERSKHGLTADDVVDRIAENLNREDAQLNEYIGAKLPVLNFSYSSIEGANNRQLNFQYAQIDGLDLQDSTVGQGIDLSHATIGRITVDDATLTRELIACRAEIKGDVSAENADLQRGASFDHTEIEGDVSIVDSTVAHPVSGVEATIHGNLSIGEAAFQHDCNFNSAEIRGETDAVEAIFRRNAEFEQALFEGDAFFHEVTFDDEARFEQATFKSEAEFQASTFSGKSHAIDNNADFSGATFADRVCFRQAEFEEATFSDTVFEDRAVFDHTVFKANVLFSESRFLGRCLFTEARFHEDADFKGAVFRTRASFKGAEFKGGSRTASDDVSFEDVIFEDEVSFEIVEFRYANFEHVDFESTAHFERAVFEGDADFIDAGFHDEADFDESRFYGDADFGTATFDAAAVFRGAEFEGEAKHLEDNARFEEVTFHKNAEFDNATFRTASFEDAEFGGVIDFHSSVFTERADFRIKTIDTDTYVNFTNAELYGGTIELLPNDVVPYDFTNATLGDMELKGEGGIHELLDYFRFCLTDFDGFDFTQHYEYLERNDWVIHSFSPNGVDIQPDEPMTDRNIELTYQKAQNTAETMSLKRAASRFGIKRNRYNRKKTTNIIRDDTVAMDSQTKGKQAVSVGVNWFMDKTCGYGNKVPRIFAFTFGTPLVFALVFALMGAQFAGPESMTPNVWQASNPLGAIWHSIYFSYITFSTVGYGDLSPVTMAAQALAVVEGMSNGVFFALLIYTLTKQSDF